MIEAHQYPVQLIHSFDEVWKHLDKDGDVESYASTGKIVRSSSGKTRDGRPVIRFFRKGIESARSYEGCWGCYYNCNRTRFGMYAKALDCSL